MTEEEHRRRENEVIIAKLKGVPAQPGTAETDADPANLNNWVDCGGLEYARAMTSEESSSRQYMPWKWRCANDA